MSNSLRIIVLLFCSLAVTAEVSAEVLLSGLLQKWQPVELDVREPSMLTSESAVSPNPFLDIALTVDFTSPSGEIFTVPGYFAGDGQGSGEGAVWRTRFAPNEVGLWAYSVSFKQGDEIAVSDDPKQGDELPSNGAVGSFTIEDIPASAQGFTALGRLEYNGHHYLKFADGPYWIKGGVDSPENFFGFAGFDNTVDHIDGVNSEGLVQGVHEYESHITDWQPGDPDFSNIATGHSGRGIIGAVNYLAEQGVNSIYFLPMNLGGDGRETYPFLGTSGSRYDNTHYDISKLRQWDLVLRHMQNKSIAAHVVLAETEQGNTRWFDDGELGVERKLYYRELVARFSYLLALKWNLSEESRYGETKHAAFADYMRQIDWAQHQLAVHTNRDRVDERYDGLLGNMDFDSTSIQYSPERAEEHVETWRKKSADAGWPWVIDMDENSPAGEGLTNSNAEELRRSVLYPVYFSGGNIEWYFGYHDLPLGGDIRTENFRTREAMFRYMRYAREFMQNELPFHEMQPDDSLHSESQSSDIQVYAKAGEAYAIYLPSGNVGGSLSVPLDRYTIQWFNPRSGQFQGELTQITGTQISQGTPPNTADNDWVVLIKKDNPEEGMVDSPKPIDENEPGDSSTNPPEEESTNPVDETSSNQDGVDIAGEQDDQEPDLQQALESLDASGGATAWLVLFMLPFMRYKLSRIG